MSCKGLIEFSTLCEDPILFSSVSHFHSTTISMLSDMPIENMCKYLDRKETNFSMHEFLGHILSHLCRIVGIRSQVCKGIRCSCNSNQRGPFIKTVRIRLLEKIFMRLTHRCNSGLHPAFHPAEATRRKHHTLDPNCI